MTSIVEFEAETRRVRVYAGGWSEFAAQREAARERHESAYARYSPERERLEEQARRMRQWEERGYGQGRKKKKTKDAKQGLREEARRGSSASRSRGRPGSCGSSSRRFARGGDSSLASSGRSSSRDGFRLGPVDLEMRHGDRLAVLGRNGAGKTTLLQALLGELPLVAGERWVGPGTVLRRAAAGPRPVRGRGARCSTASPPRADSRAARPAALLAKFALGADDVLRPGRSLSPGERSRAAIALLAARGVNALVLDEPTNNLDLEAIEQLELALAELRGRDRARQPRPALSRRLRADADARRRALRALSD